MDSSGPAPTSDNQSTTCIADQARTTLECFRFLLFPSGKVAEERHNTVDQARLDALTESYGRFRVWCGNIAAHRHDKTSLDYRLRGSPQIQLGIAKMLEDLNELLFEGKKPVHFRIKQQT